MENFVRFFYLDHMGQTIAWEDYEDIESELHADWCDTNGVFFRRVPLNASGNPRVML